MYSLFKLLSDRVPTTSVLVNAALAALIPWIVYTINRALHRYGDPAWKQEDRKGEKRKEQGAE